MKKRIIWGLGVLILLIGIAGVYLFMKQDTNTDSELVLSEETNKLLVDKSQQRRTPLVGSSDGRRQNGEWDEKPHAVPTDANTTPKTQSKLSNTEIQERIKALRAQQISEYRAKWGEAPSPDGSYQHFRDNHGNVHRHYIGTIAVSRYDLKVDFAPTPTELKRYKELLTAIKDAASKENISEMQRLNDEIRSLVNAAQGEIPDPFGFRYYGDPISGKQEKKLHNEALRSFYQRMGVEHLYELYGERSY